MYNKFFASKLNSVLLVILIILMVVAIKIMLKDKATYFPYLLEDKTEQDKPIETIDKTNILGNKDDLISFSIWPNTKVHGIVSYRGTIKGGYFFEANILVGVLDMNKKNILQSNGVAKTEWMTAGPVEFEGFLDFSKLPKGSAYIEIHNDNASGLPEHDKSILIPIVIE